MKKTFARTPHKKFIAAASAFTWAIAMANSAGAAQLQEARVTQVVNDVKLLLEQAAPRPAAVSDLVRRGNAVRTGTQSRSELTFADLTITRLGANTIFSFKEGTREMNLIDGADICDQRVEDISRIAVLGAKQSWCLHEVNQVHFQ